MWFCPNESSIHEPDLVQVLQSFDAEGEQFLGLQLRLDPGARGLQVADTFGAKEDSDMFLEAIGDIDLGTEASDTHVGGVGGHGDATHGTQHTPKGARHHEHL